MEPGQHPPDGHDNSVIGRASRWIFGQPALIVMLFAMAFQFGWLGWYVVTVGIPGHLDRIQTHTRELNKLHTDARAESEAAHMRERKELREESARWELLVRDLLKLRQAEPAAGKTK